MTRAVGAETSYDYSIHYRTWHDESDEHAARMAELHQEQLRPFLPTPGPLPVLDIGCGMWFALLALRQLGFTDLRGIDIDQEQVKSCQRRGLPVEQVRDTVAFLEERVNQYEIVLMLEVLEHVPVIDQIPLMRAVFHTLKSSGRVILMVPNANSIIASRLRFMDFTHQCSFTEHSLRYVLRNAGFNRIAIPREPELRRPPLRLWKRSSRSAFRQWLVRFLWRQVMAAEELDPSRVDDVPLSSHLYAVAFRN